MYIPETLKIQPPHTGRLVCNNASLIHTGRLVSKTLKQKITMKTNLILIAILIGLASCQPKQ